MRSLFFFAYLLLGIQGRVLAVDKPTPSPTESTFLRDVSRYLTGSEADAETVFKRYKKRVSVSDPPFPPEPPAMPMPETVEELRKDLDLDSEVFEPLTASWKKSRSGRWSRRLVADSKVKGKPRILYRRHPQKSESPISVAQTWNNLHPKTGSVRETEIAIKRKASEDWDFFVYGEDGVISAESVFRTAGGKDKKSAAPVTCLTCHYDRGKKLFTNIPLAYGGGP